MGDTATNSRKRSRTSKSPEDNSGDEGKKRGRPRVEKQDQSAADRRRTQIRMAQRAYRQRKEGTLEELRKRVSELTNTMELMNKAFLDCRDKVAVAPLAESQLQDMRETSEQFQNLMKCARNPSEECDLEIPRKPPPVQSNSTTETGPSGRPAAEPKNVPTWMDRSVVNSQPRARHPSEIGMGYTMYMPDATQNSSNSSATMHEVFHPLSQGLMPAAQQLASAEGESIPYEGFDVEVPESLFIPASVTPPITYSFNESTFARRLHRACLEQAYQLLLDPQRRPATYDRVFKLSLMVKDRNRLILGMKSLLQRRAHEDLDAAATLIHVGGAGTHYPRRDANGNFRPKKDSWNLGLVGPKTLALLENAARENLTADMTVDIAGFEGEWFDPYDVEGYLSEKGIHIDPTSSFAEAEVVLRPALPSSSSNRSTTTGDWPTTPLDAPSASTSDPPRAFDAEQLEFLNRSEVSPNEWGDYAATNMAGVGTVGYSDAGTGSWMNFLQPGETMKQHVSEQSQQPQPEQFETMTMTWEGSAELLREIPEVQLPALDPLQTQQSSASPTGQQQSEPKKTIIVDVAKFVKVLTVSAVCIGRTPGFKRRDVDRALSLASFDAF